MNARKHSTLLLRRLASDLRRFQPQADELHRILEDNQNEGMPNCDGSFSEESWNATATAERALRDLIAKLDYAIDLSEATEVGRRKRS